MKNITIGQRILCHTIIHGASASAGAVGLGLAQFPCADNAVIVPIQVSMVIALGQVFGLEFTKRTAAATAASASGTLLGRAASQLGAGWIPVGGNIINAGTAVSITEILGWMLAEDFAKKASVPNHIK
jgi:uncharacterized protein (DUF697 family)